MMDRDAVIRRAVAVKALLDNEEIKAAWGELEADLFEQWKNCKRPAKREELWHRLKNLEALQTWMRAAASKT